LAKDIKVLAHIDSKLDHGFATTKMPADFLVWGQLNVITILHGSGEFSDSPRSYMLSNGLTGDQT